MAPAARAGDQPRLPLLLAAPAGPPPSLKSRRTVLWHLGHRGSSRDSITYIMHRGHPARIIGGGAPAASGLPSDDTHELGGDAVDDDDDDSRLGEAPPPPPPTPTPPRWPPAVAAGDGW